MHHITMTQIVLPVVRGLNQQRLCEAVVYDTILVYHMVSQLFGPVYIELQYVTILSS